MDQVTWGTRVYGTTYNASGWAASTTAPAALAVTYASRDLDGRPLVTTLPGSRTLATSYDLAGNVVSVSPPTQPAHLLLANHPGKAVTYAYSLLGRLTRRVDAVTTTQTYDAAGRLATVGTSEGVLLTNGYDGTILTQQAVSGPFSHAVNKTFDNFLRASSWNVDGTSPIALTYDADNLLTSAGGMTVTRSPNGLLTGTALGGSSETWGYNAYGEVTSHAVLGSATALSVTTTRDAAGRIDVRTETIGTTTTSYRYGYDTAASRGSVRERGRGADARVDVRRQRQPRRRDLRRPGPPDAFGGASSTYGNNGELATKTVAGVTTSYSYAAHGNLRGVAGLSAGPITYVIDGQNRRVGKKVNAALVQGFLYDGARVVAELGSTGAEVARLPRESSSAESGGKSCQTLREEGTCSEPYKGSPFKVPSCVIRPTIAPWIREYSSRSAFALAPVS